MSNVALRMEHVYKKFRKGEMYNSLRDLLPALTGRMFQQRELQEGHHDFWALQDLSFEVPHGEAFGIIGHNGAGKSTALKILSKIMKPTKGSMVVDGRLSALIEVTAGFHQDLTGRENIYLHGTILGMSKSEITSKLDQIIAFSGLEDFIDTPVKRYSSGMYARLGFSVAAHVDPEVLIVDEVLSVGDYVFQRKCVNRMKDVIKSGATVLFVSHNLTTVAEFCHRCLLLDKGRSLMIGPAPEVISAYLDRSRSAHDSNSSSSPVSITKVQVRNEFGACTRFQAGEKAWIDIEIAARKRCTKLSVSLYIIDDAHQDIFNTSTERLGLGNFTLEEGESYACTYELNLNMAAGMYHPSVLAYRYDNQTMYDKWEPAATIYVSSDDDVRGFVHCAPEVIRHEIVAAPNASLASTTRNPEGQTKRQTE